MKTQQTTRTQTRSCFFALGAASRATHNRRRARRDGRHWRQGLSNRRSRSFTLRSQLGARHVMTRWWRWESGEAAAVAMLVPGAVTVANILPIGLYMNARARASSPVTIHATCDLPLLGNCYLIFPSCVSIFFPCSSHISSRSPSR